VTTLADSDVPATSLVLAPVAMMMLSNVTVTGFSGPPSTKLTSNVWSSVNEPYPWISVILFFFIRKCTPATRPSATLRLRIEGDPVVERRLTTDAELAWLPS